MNATHPHIVRFLRGGTENRVLALKGVKGKHATVTQWETFSTIALMPQVRSALLRAYANDENCIIGDVTSLMRNIPIVYEYVPLTDKWGQNRRGRPQKIQVSGA